MPVVKQWDDEPDEEKVWRDRDESEPVLIELGDASGYLCVYNDVPATRADCPPRGDRAHRLCGHCRCPHNLLLVEGDDRPGRRVNGKAPSSTLVPMWRENPVPPMCALDVADDTAATGEPLPIEQVGKYARLRPSRVHEILATCQVKLRAAGLELEELMP